MPARLARPGSQPPSLPRSRRRLHRNRPLPATGQASTLLCTLQNPAAPRAAEHRYTLLRIRFSQCSLRQRTRGRISRKGAPQQRAKQQGTQRAKFDPRALRSSAPSRESELIIKVRLGPQGFSLLSMRGKGIASRICSMPQSQPVHRSMPIPNPPCGNVPYLRRSRYQLKDSSGRLSSRIRLSK
jgi:hypothetical protein